jgi:arylsulfatase A-like enzyme
LPGQEGLPSAGAVVLLLVSCGLAAGYLDLAIIVAKKYFWNGLKNYATAADFPWTVPAGHVALVVAAGSLVAVVHRLWPRPLSLGARSWLIVTLAFWVALLRMPLYGVSSLILAGGLARLLCGAAAAHCRRPRQVRWTFAALLGLLIVLAALSSGRRALREAQAMARLPAPPPNARNVILIVWDAVRAGNLGLYGYSRGTTPNLARWARKGVRYSLALAPAPWTYPSHTTFFTGFWPFQVVSQWKYTLDAPVPTLAEYLSSRGYETAGFSANTLCCTYETRLDRGFIHFEDFPLSWRTFLGRTVAGGWILENILYRGDFFESKWIRLQSRDAQAVHRAFLDWLGARSPDRPFFAYLNDFDAHEPYVPPQAWAGRFGIRPRTATDYRFLLEYGKPGWKSLQNRDIWMARDCYDDCIGYLDDQLGHLLDALESRGILDNTLVLVTSDHGESFGDHGVFLHANGVFLDEVAVPLVILSPGAPAGRVVAEPVSLRDLPATVLDQLGLSSASPFPGHSLADYWPLAPGAVPAKVTPALSEHATVTAFQQSENLEGLRRRDVQMSLVAQGRHYIRDGMGSEQLYDIRRDPVERTNLVDPADTSLLATDFRHMLLGVLNENHGSKEAEDAYLTAYRQWLESIAGEERATAQPISARNDRLSPKRE